MNYQQLEATVGGEPKKEAQDAPLFDHACLSSLEISGTSFMAAITIEFDRLACALA
jgi:hypothetical protein